MFIFWTSLVLSIHKCVGSGSLWDLSIDPTEEVDVFSRSDYSAMKEYLEERLSYWKDKYVSADNSDTSDSKDASTIYDDCGGICPYVNNYYTPVNVSQIYHPSNAPHVIFVLVDDWGWNDIGFRSTYMNWTTPTIDKLAKEGIVMDNYFTQSFCVPSRGALMTGRQAVRLGLLEDVDGNELPLDEFTIAQEFKSAGYMTYMVGKWHLGYSSLARTPTYRGFDFHYGYFDGFMDYYTKTFGDYLDLQSNGELVSDEDEISSELHSAYLFQEKAEAMIADHAANYPNIPMFLYYSMQLLHFPYEVPSVYYKRCSDSGLTDDVAYCGMNLMLDEVIANLTCVMLEYDFEENFIFVLASDNGGESSISGNSVPFRGHKYDISRGGVGANAIVVSSLIDDDMRGTAYSGQMHVSDWLPTLMTAATNGEWTGSYVGAELDGVSMWDAIITNGSSPRREIVHYINSDGTEGSLQYDLVKLDWNVTVADCDEVSTYFDTDLDPSLVSTVCANPSLVQFDVLVEETVSPTPSPSVVKRRTSEPTPEPTSKHHPSTDVMDKFVDSTSIPIMHHTPKPSMVFTRKPTDSTDSSASPNTQRTLAPTEEQADVSAKAVSFSVEVEVDTERSGTDTKMSSKSNSMAPNDVMQLNTVVDVDNVSESVVVASEANPGIYISESTLYGGATLIAVLAVVVSLLIVKVVTSTPDHHLRHAVEVFAVSEGGHTPKPRRIPSVFERLRSTNKVSSPHSPIVVQDVRLAES